MIFAALKTFATGTFLNTFTSIILVLTSCGCFLVGVNLMSRGFVKATDRENSFFVRGFASSNRVKGVLTGILHSAVVQSSDVTSVTLVRLADLGTITLFQACACIIGANIGTTITTFIISLSSFNLTPFFAFFAFVGAIPLLSKKRKLRTFGEIVAGFGVLFIGIQLLESNIQNDSFRALVQNLFNLTTNPLLLIFVGAALTSLVQSSSVVTSMVVFLISASLLPIRSAFCLVVGANIGTCFTSWIASFGSSRTARQTAFFHTLYNLIGAAIFIVVLYTPINNAFFNMVGAMRIKAEFKVALFHLGFNLCAALVVIPLLRPLVWFSKKVIRH